jgi:hypothetical protein
MSLNAGSELGMSLQADRNLSYGQIESALVDAGFTDYTIMRSRNPDTTDFQVTVRSGELTPEGYMAPLDAAETLSALATAVSALAEQAPA